MEPLEEDKIKLEIENLKIENKLSTRPWARVSFWGGIAAVVSALMTVVISYMTLHYIKESGIIDAKQVQVSSEKNVLEVGKTKLEIDIDRLEDRKKSITDTITALNKRNDNLVATNKFLKDSFTLINRSVTQKQLELNKLQQDFRQVNESLEHQTWERVDAQNMANKVTRTSLSELQRVKEQLQYEKDLEAKCWGENDSLKLEISRLKKMIEAGKRRD